LVGADGEITHLGIDPLASGKHYFNRRGHHPLQKTVDSLENTYGNISLYTGIGKLPESAATGKLSAGFAIGKPRLQAAPLGPPAENHEFSLRSSGCAILFPSHYNLFGVVMAIERTLSIIKPDAVAKNVIGKIYSRFETNGLRIVAARMLHLTPEQAGEFYAIHKGKPFYDDLIAFMTSGPVMVQVLEGENAIAKNREIMGATNPKEAAAGTIRADFAETVDENAVHGSDAPETAEQEIAFFFPEGVCERTR